MSHSALVGLTVVCFVAALGAELGGIALLVGEARGAARSIRRWRAANPERHSEGSYAQHEQLNDVLEQMLGHGYDRVLAIALLVVGVLLGASGNFISLVL